MEDLGTELKEYERQTIVLRLDRREANILLCHLVTRGAGCPRHTREDASRVCDKLAYEMDVFRWRDAA